MRILQLLVATALFLALASCKWQRASESQTLELDFPPEEGLFDFTKCDCDDTACWNKETASKTAEQLRCAKDALSTAFPVAGSIADLAIAATQIAGINRDLEGVEAALRTNSKTLEVIGQFSPECVGDALFVGKALTTLMADSTKVAGDINTLIKGDETNGISLAGVGRGLQDVAAVVTSFVGVATSLGKTSDCLEKYFNQAKAPAAAAASVKGFKGQITAVRTKILSTSKSWGASSTLAKINVAKTIGVCGVRIVKGLHTLANNTVCLADDFKQLAEQRQAIANQTAVLASNPSLSGSPNEAAIKANPDLCLNNPRDNSATIMGKLGAYYSTIALGGGLRESDSLYADRCAEVCGDGGNGPICRDFLATQDFGVGCSGLCTTRQKSSAVAICVSTCCLNDNNCRERALGKAQFATKELQETADKVSDSAKNMGLHCGQGDGTRELVRDTSSSYVSYTPPYESCSPCCSDLTFQDGSKLPGEEVNGCAKTCALRGKELGKSLTQ